jgi:hypothetical protein
MNDPLSSSVTKGYFRYFSAKNREADLACIKDLKDDKLILSNNPCKFPVKIYVINLDRREDRWIESNVRNLDLFSKIQVERFSAIELPNPVDAIFESFVGCLERGFETEETIIVMEDDAYLADGGFEKLRLAYESLPEDWDCLIGNHYFFGEIKVLSDHLAKPVGEASTLNFAVFRNTILEKIKQNMHLRQSVRMDIDHFITSDEVPINNYTVWPMISRESLSFSDHKKTVKDMTIRIRENASLFQFIDSETYYPGLRDW